MFSDFVPMPADIETLSLRLCINGELRQEGGVALMMYKPHAILQELSTFTHLEDGDIIMTGTPKGVGIIHCGEKFEATVLDGTNVLLTAAWTAK